MSKVQQKVSQMRKQNCLFLYYRWSKESKKQNFIVHCSVYVISHAPVVSAANVDAI